MNFPRSGKTCASSRSSIHHICITTGATDEKKYVVLLTSVYFVFYNIESVYGVAALSFGNDSACVVAAAVVFFPLYIRRAHCIIEFYQACISALLWHTFTWIPISYIFPIFRLTHTHTCTDIGSICNIWLGSSAMRCLLGLTVSCFERLHPHEEEEFINCLLSTYMQNAPHFDWVVARLGSCFPQKVISKWVWSGWTRNFYAEN